jgi:hypothetical protein
LSITVVNSATSSGTSSPITISAPAGITTGDVLVAWINVYGSSAPTIANPTGWTTIGTDATSGNERCRLAYLVCDGNTGASWGWTLTNSSYNSGGIIALRGCDAANPIDVSNTGNGTSGSVVTVTTITTTNANEMVLFFMADYYSSALNFYNEQLNSVNMDGEQFDVNANRTGSACAYKIQAAAGATGSATATISGTASNWIGALVALIPATINPYIVASATATGTSTIAVNAPTGCAAGDVLFAWITAGDNTSDPTITNPSGWTTVDTDVSGNYLNYGHGHLAWHAWASGETSYSWTIGGSSPTSSGSIVAVRGTSSTAPVDVSSSVGSGGGQAVLSVTIPSMTTNVNGDLILVFPGGYSNATNRFWSYVLMNSTTYIPEQLDVGTAVPNGAFYYRQKTAGATGTFYCYDTGLTYALLGFAVAIKKQTMTPASVAGSIRPTGTLVSRTKKAFTGALRPTGTVSRTRVRVSVGNLKPAGHLTAVLNVVKFSIHTATSSPVLSKTISLVVPPSTLVPLTTNGDFETGSLSPWTFNVNSPASATATIISGNAYSGAYSLQVDIANQGINAWDIQIPSNSFKVIKGVRYRIRLAAKAASARTIHIGCWDSSLNDSTSPWWDLNLTTSWQGFIFEFEAIHTSSPDGSKFCLQLGAAGTAQVILDSLELSQIGLIPRDLANSDFESGALTPWQLSVAGGAAATASVTTGSPYNGTYKCQVDITNGGSGQGGWEIYFYRSLDSPIISGKRYYVRFAAKAATARTMQLGLTNQFATTLLSLTTSWQVFYLEFTGVGESAPTVYFVMGENTNQVQIDWFEFGRADSDLVSTYSSNPILVLVLLSGAAHITNSTTTSTPVLLIPQSIKFQTTISNHTTTTHPSMDLTYYFHGEPSLLALRPLSTESLKGKFEYSFDTEMCLSENGSETRFSKITKPKRKVTVPLGALQDDAIDFLYSLTQAGVTIFTVPLWPMVSFLTSNATVGSHSMQVDSTLEFSANEKFLISKAYNPYLYDFLTCTSKSSSTLQFTEPLSSTYYSAIDHSSDLGFSNGDFESGSLWPPWYQYVSGGAAATATVTTGSPYNGTYKCQVNITNGGTAYWSVQVAQVVNFIAGVQYRIRFAAKASVNRSITVAIWDNPTTTEPLNHPFSISTTWQVYTLDFTVSETSSPGGSIIYFALGNQGANQVYLDFIDVTNIGDLPVSVPTGEIGFVLPCIQGYVTTSTFNMYGLPALISDLEVDAGVWDSVSLPSAPSTFLVRPETVKFETLKVEREVLGESVGVLKVYPYETQTRLAFSLTWNFTDGAWTTVRDLFLGARGRYSSFYIPTWSNELTITADAAAGSSAIHLTPNYSYLWSRFPKLLIIPIYGAPFITTISGSSGSGVFSCSSLSTAVTSGMKASFVPEVRFSNDSIEFTFLSKNFGSVTATFIEIL